MKNIILTISLAFVSCLGLFLALIQFYANSDEISRPLYGSIEYLITSILIFIFLYSLDEKISVVLKWTNFLFILAFTLWGLLLALISFYASPTEQNELLASILFVVSAIVSSSAMLFLFSKPISGKIIAHDNR